MLLLLFWHHSVSFVPPGVIVTFITGTKELDFAVSQRELAFQSGRYLDFATEKSDVDFQTDRDLDFVIKRKN